jgi:uncharacterized membrane protein required for colicin V production
MDVLLLGFIAGLIVGGYRTGLIRRLAGLGFLALSFVLGAYLRAPIGGLISGAFKDVPQSYGELVAYIFIFPVILIGAHVVANEFLKHVAVNGLSRDADRALGAIFGGVEAILIISVAIVILDTYFASKSPLPAGSGLGFLKPIRDSLDGSVTAQILRSTTVPFLLTILGPLLPHDVTSVVVGGIPALPPGVPGIPGLPTPRPSATR